MRLNLYQFDGSPLNPMYLAYKPPQMLPTQTLNPTATSSGAGGSKSTSTGSSKAKSKRRWLDDDADPQPEPLNKNALLKGTTQPETDSLDRWWWIGVGMTGLGGVLYFCF